MRRLLGTVLLLLAAGCGSGESAVAVTPVMADTMGTYRLIASRSGVASPGGASTFFSYSSGTLRLDDLSYTRSVTGQGREFSSGAYQLGTSVDTILNFRHGGFSLTSTDPPFQFTGSYDVTPDFTLTLSYDPFLLPDQGLVSRTETWFKESDSPRH